MPAPAPNGPILSREQWMDALEQPRPDALARLLEAGANPNQHCAAGEDKHPRSLLFHALCSPLMGPAQEVPRHLAGAGADLEAPLSFCSDPERQPNTNCAPSEPWAVDGATALGFAAYLGQGSAVTDLLAAGANLHHASRQGLTPLHLAAMGSNGKYDTALPIIARLIDAGADPGALDAKDRTPLQRWIAYSWIWDDPDEGPLPTDLACVAHRLLDATLAARPGHAPVIALELAVARDRKDEPILQFRYS